MRSLALALLLGLAHVAAAQNASPVLKREIALLFTALEHSGCQFNRNGAWYGTQKATAHLRRKYDYLLKKNLLRNTESFIDLAASRSSMSGRPYLVRCGSKAHVQSKEWFTAELMRLRSAAGANTSFDSNVR